MHVGVLAGNSPVLRLFGPGVGTPFGNLTSGGGNARAFADPVSATATYGGETANCAFNTSNPGMGILGLILPAPMIIQGYKAWSSGTGWDEASQAATITHQLQGSNNTTTGLDGTWTTLYTNSFADAGWGTQDIQDVHSGVITTTAYLAFRLYITGTFPSGGQSFECNGLRFYKYSWI